MEENTNQIVSVDSEQIYDPLIGKVSRRDLVKEMQTSYMEYAMSVIVARALPDVRDGLKPIHRRILFAMDRQGWRSNSKYVKSAKIVGEVMGNYHPHGDAAIYDAMVRMAQPFSMGQTLIDGQGNFGSIDGDGAAASRYTEARMTKLSNEVLADIDKETVPFIPTYDGTLQEPSVLPTKVPLLLLNGTLGIAVGMMTNIPPHNLGELCDAIVKLIDAPESTVDDLLQIIEGPDLPSAGQIYGGSGMRDAYLTGRGKFVMRSVAEIEDRKGGFRIVVSEIPYQVNKADLVSRIAELVKDKKIEGITDIRDESNRDGVRIVIELKSNSYPKKVLNKLFEMTTLQTTFHVNMLALVNEIEPRVLNLKEVLDEFIRHRQLVIRRRSEYDLQRAKERAHILEGLLKAIDIIDEVIATIRGSKNRDTAREQLIKKYQFTELQANAILDMRLASLVGLERARLQAEYDEKMKLIAYLEDLLAHEVKILAVVREETLLTKQQYAVPRKTKIIKSDLDSFRPEDLIPDEQVLISLTKTNYIKRLQSDTFKNQIRGGKGVIGMGTKDEDEVDFLLSARTHDTIYFFTDKGKLYKTSVYEIPVSNRQSKGHAIVNLIQIGQDEKVTAVLTLAKGQDIADGYFIMGTTNGTIKKTEVKAYSNVRKSGIIAITLDPSTSLRWVHYSQGNDIVMMVSAKSQAIVFNETDVRPTGRSSAGVRGMKLRPDDEVVSMSVLTETQLKTAQMLVVFENGFGKRTPLSHFDTQKRGGVGIKAAAVTNKVGNIVYASVVDGTEGSLMLISKQGTVIKTALSMVKSLGRVTQGVTLMRLSAGDMVASATILEDEPKETEVGPTK